MAKKVTENIGDELRDIMAQNKLVIGTEKTLKSVRNNTLERIYMTVNAPKIVKEDTQHYASLNNIEVKELSQTNEELGIMCKKPFSISMVGVLKE